MPFESLNDNLSYNKELEFAFKEPICPYCNQILDKFPQKKKKCSACGKYIFVRTRPSDRKKVLIREDMIPEIENEWKMDYYKKSLDEIVNRYKTAYPEEFIRKRDEDKKFSDNDIVWRIFINERIKEVLKPGMGRNSIITQEMADFLRYEGRDKIALEYYLEVCYLNLNLLKHIMLTEKRLAPGILFYIQEYMKTLNLEMGQIKRIFLEHNKKIEAALGLPISTEIAWGIFERVFFEYISNFSNNNKNIT